MSIVILIVNITVFNIVYTIISYHSIFLSVALNMAIKLVISCRPLVGLGKVRRGYMLPREVTLIRRPLLQE
jgi:hypothetical protein